MRKASAESFCKDYKTGKRAEILSWFLLGDRDRWKVMASYERLAYEIFNQEAACGCFQPSDDGDDPAVLVY